MPPDDGDDRDARIRAAAFAFLRSNADTCRLEFEGAAGREAPWFRLRGRIWPRWRPTTTRFTVLRNTWPS